MVGTIPQVSTVDECLRSKHPRARFPAHEASGEATRISAYQAGPTVIH